MSDNPQAFPCLDSSDGGLSMRDPGMTLRDWFAGQALAGYCAADGTDGLAHSSVARQSYALADAMLEARKAKLQADGDKLAGALKRSRTGWANVLELGLLPVTHEDTALDLGMEATQALTEWKDRA